LAAVAEYEASIQSERMKEVLAARKARSSDESRPCRTWPRSFPPGCQRKSAVVRRARADARAADLAPLLQKAMAEGKSYAVIAAEFNARGVRPLREARWTSNSVWRLVTIAFEGQRPVTDDGRHLPIGAAQVRVAKLLHEIGPLLVMRRKQGAT